MSKMPDKKRPKVESGQTKDKKFKAEQVRFMYQLYSRCLVVLSVTGTGRKTIH
jgi:hypothetical protein